MTSRAASSPASASRNAAVSDAERARRRAAGEIAARERERRQRRDREHQQEEPAQRVEPERRRDVAAEAPRRSWSPRPARRRRVAPEQRDARRLRGRARRASRAGQAATTRRAPAPPRRRRRSPRRAHVSARPRSPARRAEVLAREAVEQRLALLEVRRDDPLRELEQLERAPVLDAVVDARPLAPALDQALLAQGGELLRRAARVQLERRLQGADPALALAQQLQQPDPHRMTERPKELGLERVDRWRRRHETRSSSANLRRSIDNGAVRRACA